MLASEISAPGTSKGGWGGVAMLAIDGNGGGVRTTVPIAASLVADPRGLAYRAASSEVFVANYHGGTAEDGVAGSISRFKYDAAKRTFTPSGTILDPSLDSTSVIAFAPDGELFAVNFAKPVSRFTFDAQGVAVPHGTIATPAPSSAWSGLAVAPDGKRIYVTNQLAEIHQFDVASGAELATVSAPAGVNLYQMCWRGRDLYVTSSSDKVHRFTVDLADQPAYADPPIVVASGMRAIGISRTGNELLVGTSSGPTLAWLDVMPLNGSAWSHAHDVFVSGYQIGGVLALP